MNNRPIGKTEFRQVTIKIGSARRVRVLRVRTLRALEGTVAQTVCCLMAPRPLSNLNYVVTESRGCIEPFSIVLYLPFAFGVLREVATERRREGFLGSDFAYDDLRTWLYEEDHRYEVVEENESYVRVRGLCEGRTHLVRHGSAPFEIIIDPEHAFIRGIDYLSQNGLAVVRSYRAHDIRVVDHVHLPERMEMINHRTGHVTTIHLERAWYDRSIEADVFDKAFRKHTKDYLSSL